MPLLGDTIGDNFDRTAARFGDRAALADVAAGRRWTYRELADEVDAVAPEGRTADGEMDPAEDFFHDVPADVTAEAMAQGAPVQSQTPMADPWPLERWPDVPTRFLQGRDDRFFPLEFQRRVAGERLGTGIDVVPGGHLAALSRPAELAGQLARYL